MGGTPDDCAEYRIANDTTEPLAYTITFSCLSASGGALDTTEWTVPSVGPGRTVRRTLPMTGLGGDTSGGVQVRLLKVRRVPADEASWRGGPCPASGMRPCAGAGGAATGLRVVPVYLENCGTAALGLDGFPRLQLLDEEGEPVDGVRVLRGGDGIASGTGVAAGPWHRRPGNAPAPDSCGGTRSTPPRTPSTRRTRARVCGPHRTRTP